MAAMVPCTVVAWISWSRIMAPSEAPLMMRFFTVVALRFFQSKVSTDQ